MGTTYHQPYEVKLFWGAWLICAINIDLHIEADSSNRWKAELGQFLAPDTSVWQTVDIWVSEKSV